MEALLDRVFAPKANPWRHLGALAFIAFLVCLVSGLYLYAVFDTSVAGAYESGRALDRDALLVGRLVRGLHRYSADALVVFTVLHLLREALRGHFARFRAWSWVSGLAVVPLAWLAGLTGFWLAWDERAVVSAAATADWLAAWPWGATQFPRNFLSGAAFTDRFFSLAVFLHLGLPLLAFAALWAHLARLGEPRAWPPKGLAAGLVATLAVLSLAWPAQSVGRPDLLDVPASVAFDWFYLFPHALASAIGPEGLSLALVACALALAALPWWPRRARVPIAVVDAANCNGCERCVADCPFVAVTMVPVQGRRRARHVASVNATLCAGCGICAGACPSSTPFRRLAPLATGIDLSGRSIDGLRRAADARLALEPRAVLVFACRPARLEESQAGVRPIVVECLAMLPPAFVDYVLRRGAAGVVLAGCRADDCEYRLGDAIVEARLAGRRAPVLRRLVPRERVRLVWCGPDAESVAREVRAMRGLRNV